MPSAGVAVSSFMAVLITVIQAIAFPNEVRGAECATCAQKQKELVGLEASEKQHQDLLSKNQQFLETVKEDPSKAIKVKSNILIIAVKLETFKNNIAYAKDELTQKGCKACPIR